VKALKEIGWKKALKYAWGGILMGVYRLICVPQVRAWWLRVLGAKVGKSAIIHKTRFINWYRRGFKGLAIGNDCFIGEETMIDLASDVTFEDDVTLAERVVVLTHLNVGYKDHPLQKYFPAHAKPVVIRRGTFVGANTTILAGVEIGEYSFVAAASLVNKDVKANHLVGGVPCGILRLIQ